MTIAMRLQLIGQMEAFIPGGDNVLPIGRRTRALLAILALAVPHPMLRSHVAALLWSRRLEEQARGSLRQEVHRLLEALQPVGANVLTMTQDHLALRPDLVWVDVEAVLQASVLEPSALSLMNAEVLEGFDGLDPALDSWLSVERERIRDRARTVAEAILRAQTGPTETICAARQLLIIDRANEDAWRALMRANAVLGERGMALQAYDRCRAVLADYLDAKPSLETQRLAAEIRRDDTSVPPTPGMEAVMPRGEWLSAGGAKIGMLPVQVSGCSEEERHLAAGLVDETTAALARFRWMAVVSTASLAQLGSRKEAGLRQTFGLDFLIDGSVQRAGPRLRVAMRLLDLRESGQVVWTRRFDRLDTDLLLLQEEIAAEVAAQIDQEVLMIEGRRVASQMPEEPSAYDLASKALFLIVRLRRDKFSQAGLLLTEALALQPNYAAAHAWRAYWLAVSVDQGRSDDPEAVSVEAWQHARRAITLDPQDARGLAIAGHIRAYLHHKPREALELHGRALSLNPHLAMAWGYAATTHTYLGEIDEATRRFERYKQLSPMDASAFLFDSYMIVLEIQRRNYEGAVSLGRRSYELHPSFLVLLKHYLVALGHAKIHDVAGDIRSRLLAIEPSFTVQHFLSRSPFDREEDRDHYALGLRLGGVPEGTP